MNKLKPDVVLKEFWRDNERFADLFNTILFDGQQVIEPESLTEQDTDVSTILGLKEYHETLSRTRDVVKKSSHGVDFVILGIESQKLIHYAMPLRTAVIDVLGYVKECEKIIKRNMEYYKKKKNRKKNKRRLAPMSSAEFLSGMYADDRIHPIISLVIYYDETPWTGPISLTDMMEIPAEFKGLVCDYSMNLLQVRESGKYTFKNADVETVFQVSREIYDKNFKKIEAGYHNRNIRSELGVVIGTITGSNKLINQSLQKEGGTVNMCRALDEWEQENIEAGRQEGRIEGRELGKLEGQRLLIKTILQNGIDVEQVAQFTNISVAEINELQNEC